MVRSGHGRPDPRGPSSLPTRTERTHAATPRSDLDSRAAPRRRSVVAPRRDGVASWLLGGIGGRAAVALRRRRRPDAHARTRRAPSRRPIPEADRPRRRPSPSTGAATATASGCRSTAPAAAPWPARPRRRSSPTTTGARPSARSRPSTPIRVLVLSGWTATPAAPLLVYGRLTAWTIDGIAGTLPGRRDAAPDPDDDLDRDRPADDLAAAGHRGRRRRAPRRAEAGQRRRPRRDGAGQLQLSSKPSSYDSYRGALRIIASADDADRQRRQRAPARDVPARRRPGRDAVDLADRRPSRPRRSRPARMPPAGCARASRTTT